MPGSTARDDGAPRPPTHLAESSPRWAWITSLALWAAGCAAVKVREKALSRAAREHDEREREATEREERTRREAYQQGRLDAAAEALEGCHGALAGLDQLEEMGTAGLEQIHALTGKLIAAQRGEQRGLHLVDRPGEQRPGRESNGHGPTGQAGAAQERWPLLEERGRDPT